MRQNKGFTLIELLVVLCLVGVVVAIIAPLFFGETSETAAPTPVAISEVADATIYKSWVVFDDGNYSFLYRVSAKIEEKPEEVFSIQSEALFGQLHDGSRYKLTIERPVGYLPEIVGVKPQ